jgi:hypothetical protein
VHHALLPSAVPACADTLRLLLLLLLLLLGLLLLAFCCLGP